MRIAVVMFKERGVVVDKSVHGAWFLKTHRTVRSNFVKRFDAIFNAPPGMYPSVIDAASMNYWLSDPNGPGLDGVDWQPRYAIHSSNKVANAADTF